MKLTVLGAAGAWPLAGGACSGYVIEHDGFCVLVDPGYATLPRLLEFETPEAIDAVLVSHGHSDHVADLNPLLRARVMRRLLPPRLPIYALPDALRPVLALDRRGMLDAAYDLREFSPGDAFEIGPFEVASRLLPHSVPNVGVRLTASGCSITYTGDAGPSDELVDLATGTDLLLAEATYVEHVPYDSVGILNCALEVGRQAHRAAAGRLLLTHLMPGTDPDASREFAGRGFLDRIGVAEWGTVLDL